MNIRNAIFKKDHENILAIAQAHPDITRFRDRYIFSTDQAYASGWIQVVETDYDEIVGFTCSRVLIRKPVTSLYFLCVAEKWRGKGLGTQLMDNLEKISNQDWSCNSIRLKVTPTNTRAIEFFQKRGYAFEKDGKHMKKDIP